MRYEQTRRGDLVDKKRKEKEKRKRKKKEKGEQTRKEREEELDREREKGEKRKRGIFSVFRRLNLDGPRVKVDPRIAGYA